MTEQELREIEERCEAATPGPWRYGSQWDSDVCEDKASICIWTNEDEGAVAEVPSAELKRGDLLFTIYARTDIPSLITAYREQRAELELVLSERNVLISNFLSEECPIEKGYDIPWCELEEQCGDMSCDFGVEKCWCKWAEHQVLDATKEELCQK